MTIHHTQFLKDKHLIYITLSTDGLILPNLNQAYEPDMRYTDHDLGWSTPEVTESLQIADRRILAHGVSTTCITLWTPAQDVWKYTTVTKRRTPNGELEGVGVNQCVDTMYSGWPAFLDKNNQQLILPNNTTLSAKDMTLLHWFLIGMPRKVMAEKSFVTVKAIEKRLTRLRDQLDHHSCCTLHECLMHLDLIPFLLAHVNWFELKPFNRVNRTK